MFIAPYVSTNVFDEGSPLMKFRACSTGLSNHQHQGQHYRYNLCRCNLGFLNVCSLRHSLHVQPDGTCEFTGDAEVETLKQRMRDHKLYALALSEVRLPGTGVADVGNDFKLLYAGGSVDFLGGVGILLSPRAYTAWCLAGRQVRTWSSGRLLSISFALHQGEGRWHIAAAYGPTLQSSESEKANFLQDLTEFWQATPARDPAFVIG